MKINTGMLRSPPFIFAAYVVASCLLILGFRLIFPGELSPLPIFSRDWRLIRGLLDIIALFPALALSALVVPFGIASDEGYYAGFSVRLFERMAAPVITAIGAAGLYALLFFLVLPIAHSYEGDMRFKGEMYRLAKEQAQVNADAGKWIEASQFIGICDSAWENSPELEKLRTETEIEIERSRFMAHQRSGRLSGADVSALPGQREPMDAAEAIALGEAAFGEGRYMDAHWLATLGSRIAAPGSIEAAASARLAARAWNQIENQQPESGESQLSSFYQKKKSGYEAMVSGDWIRAFYIFQELIEVNPNDPDIENFLAASEKGTKEIAFFIDEMEMSPGKTHTGAIFSLPVDGYGRSVLRVSSLSETPDYAYGIDLEYMVFDPQSRPLYRLEAPFAKFLPITLDGQQKVLVLMRALERRDSALRWEPRWFSQGSTAPGMAQITLNVSYETFVALSQLRQGLPGMQMGDLFKASRMAGETGYIPQVFEAEILNRLGSCIFFLPMAIIAIAFGWFFRARKRSRYFFIPVLPVLPLVFSGIVYLYRACFNTIGISLILAAGFSLALALFIVILIVSLVLSLIVLAAQRS